MTDPYQKPCFDSSVFIGGLDDEICRGIKRGVIYRYLIDKVQSREYNILISALALAEVYKKKRFKTPEGKQLDEFLELTDKSFVQIIEVDREIGKEAHWLCRTYANLLLKPADAIHLACALRAGCDVLLTWDRPLATVMHDKIRVEAPEIHERGLFAESEFATPEEISAYQIRKKLEIARVSVPVRKPTALGCGGDPVADLAITEACEKVKYGTATPKRNNL